MNKADRRRADTLHERAGELDDDAQALAMYRQALEIDPRRADTHYNMGLIYKYQGRWQESFDHNRQAVALDPNDEASNWNLAIAATALRDWRTARDVWNRLGLAIRKGEAPIEDDFGITPVRLDPDDRGEVVWARRIDPVRARIENVPLPESGFRRGDVVLHDGAAVGHRVSGGKSYPVFNVLALFEAGPYATWLAEVSADGVADVKALCDALDAAGAAAEDWTTNVRTLCKQCSEGTPHDVHDRRLVAEPDGRYRLGIAPADVAAAKRALHAWDAGRGRVLGFDCVVPVPANAHGAGA